MIKVISFKICPFVQRVTALLEAKKIPYEVELISLRELRTEQSWAFVGSNLTGVLYMQMIFGMKTMNQTSW